jgi:predicted nucleic acid-binding protein
MAWSRQVQQARPCGMSRLAVDTDVVSFLFKNHSVARLYDADLAGNTLVLSFMTVAELDRWTIQSKWGKARRNWLHLYLDPFVILPFDRALCTKWAEVTVAAQARGIPHRVCGRLDRRYRTPIPSTTGDSQSRRLPERSRADRHLAWSIGRTYFSRTRCPLETAFPPPLVLCYLLPWDSQREPHDFAHLSLQL